MRKSAESHAAPPDLSFLARPRPTGPLGTRATAPLLAAGDPQQLLVVHPFKFDYNEGKSLELFEVLYRRANAGAWSVANYDGHWAWSSYPQAVAFMPHSGSPGSLFVMNVGGYVDEFQARRIKIMTRC